MAERATDLTKDIFASTNETEIRNVGWDILSCLQVVKRLLKSGAANPMSNSRDHLRREIRDISHATTTMERYASQHEQPLVYSKIASIKKITKLISDKLNLW